MKRYLDTYRMGKLDRLPAERDPIPLQMTYASLGAFLRDYDKNLSATTSRIRCTRMPQPGVLVEMQLMIAQIAVPIVVDALVRGADGEDLTIAILATSHAKLKTLVEQVRNRDPSVLFRPINVLIVEDNNYVREAVQRGLTGGSRHDMRDYVLAFDTAENGADGLELMKRQTFDLAIVDVYLPVLDGATLVQRARSSLGLDLPIITMSAGGSDAQGAAMAAGASAFLPKPVRLREVAATMRQLLDERYAPVPSAG